MSKDLVRKNDVSKPERTDVSKPERTEVDKAAHALAEMMLFGTERPAADRPRIILAFDCTASMGEYIAARKINGLCHRKGVICEGGAGRVGGTACVLSRLRQPIVQAAATIPSFQQVVYSAAGVAARDSGD